MDWLIFFAGVAIGIVLFEFAKHFFVKRAGRLVIFIVILFVLFVVFSAVFINSGTFKDSKAVQTGASIANVFTKNTEGVREGVKNSSLFNSTFKRE